MKPVASENWNQSLPLWGMILHLSMLLGVALPLVGFVAPIVIWQVKKQSIPGIDEHGRAAVNWMLSSLIYAVIGGLLVLLVIGIPLLILLGILGVVFPIIAGIKASDGQAWRYPLSIPFFV